MNMLRFSSITVVYINLLVILALISYYIPLNAEGLAHYNCHSTAEAWNTAILSYMHMNPRIGEMACYFLGHQAEVCLSVIHTILSFAAIILIYRLGIGDWPKSSAKSILTLLFIFFTFIGFNTHTYWFLGNMSWLYPCTVALALLYITEPFFKGHFRISSIHTLLAIPFSFITGMSNNNTPIVVWSLLAACGIYYFLIKKQARPSWQYAIILITLSTSCALYYLAPGNYERAQQANWELSFHNILFNSLLAPNNWILIVVLLWRLGVSSLILYFLKIKTNSRISKARIGILSISLVMLWSVLITAPHWGAPRAFLPLELAITCIMAHLFFSVSKNLNLAKAWSLLLFHCAIMATLILPSIGKLISSQREWDRIVSLAEKAKQNNQNFVVIKRSQLDFTPTFPRLFGLPGSFFNYRVSPTIQLIPCREDQTLHTNHQHKWIESTWVSDSGDHIMNPIAAKKLGLKAVYYLADK